MLSHFLHQLLVFFTVLVRFLLEPRSVPCISQGIDWKLITSNFWSGWWELSGVFFVELIDLTLNIFIHIQAILSACIVYNCMLSFNFLQNHVIDDPLNIWRPWVSYIFFWWLLNLNNINDIKSTLDELKLFLNGFTLRWRWLHSGPVSTIIKLWLCLHLFVKLLILCGLLADSLVFTLSQMLDDIFWLHFCIKFSLLLLNLLDSPQMHQTGLDIRFNMDIIAILKRCKNSILVPLILLLFSEFSVSFNLDLNLIKPIIGMWGPGPLFLWLSLHILVHMLVQHLLLFLLFLRFHKYQLLL